MFVCNAVLFKLVTLKISSGLFLVNLVAGTAVALSSSTAKLVLFGTLTTWDLRSAFMAWTQILINRTEEIRGHRQRKHTVETTPEHTACECVEQMHKYETKLTGMEDPAQRVNFLMSNLKKGQKVQMHWIPWEEFFPSGSLPFRHLSRADEMSPTWTRDRTPRQRQIPPPTPAHSQVTSLYGQRSDSQGIQENAPEVSKIQIKFAADYSETTAKHCKSCCMVMDDAQKKGFQAFLLWPATIKLTKDNNDYVFQEAGQQKTLAQLWIEQLMRLFLHRPWWYGRTLEGVCDCILWLCSCWSKDYLKSMLNIHTNNITINISLFSLLNNLLKHTLNINFFCPVKDTQCVRKINQTTVLVHSL